MSRLRWTCCPRTSTASCRSPRRPTAPSAPRTAPTSPTCGHTCRCISTIYPISTVSRYPDLCIVIHAASAEFPRVPSCSPTECQETQLFIQHSSPPLLSPALPPQLPTYYFLFVSERRQGGIGGYSATPPPRQSKYVNTSLNMETPPHSHSREQNAECCMHDDCCCYIVTEENAQKMHRLPAAAAADWRLVRFR